MGLTGVGLFYGDLYHYFGINESLVPIGGIINYFMSLTDSNGIIPTMIGIGNSSVFNYDLSYLEGLTGTGFFYLNAYKSLNSNSIFSPSVYSQVLNNNSPKRSVAGFDILTLTTMIFLVVIQRRIRRKN